MQDVKELGRGGAYLVTNLLYISLYTLSLERYYEIIFVQTVYVHTPLLKDGHSFVKYPETLYII